MSDTDVGIQCSEENLQKGSCKMNVYETLGPNVDPENKDLKSFAMDIFGGLTMFIGFVVFVTIIYSGFLLIIGGANEKQFDNGKKGIMYGVLGLLLVGSAYGIIKFIQYIVK